LNEMENSENVIRNTKIPSERIAIDKISHWSI
jgi:hypothetical protein